MNRINTIFTRTLRTASSERYLLQLDEQRDAAALDLHFLDDGSVAGTLTLLDERHAADAAVQEILKTIDELLLPMASLDDRNLNFTIVVGRLVGNFVAEPE